MPQNMQQRLPRLPVVNNPFGRPMMGFMDVAGPLRTRESEEQDFITGQPMASEDAADVAAGVNADMSTDPQAATMPPVQPDQNDEPSYSQLNMFAADDAPPAATAQHANQRRALANALLQQGQQERQGGALGALARVAQTAGGAWMSNKAQQEEETSKEATNAEWQKILANSPDEQSLVNNMMRSNIPEIRDRAVEAQLKSRLAPKQTNTWKPGTLQTYDDGGFRYTREYQSDGTWKPKGKEAIRVAGAGGDGSGISMDEKRKLWRITAQRILNGEKGAMAGIPRGDKGEAYYGIQQELYGLGAAQTNPKTGQPYTEADIGRLISNAGLEYQGAAAANRVVRQRAAMVQFSAHAVTTQAALIRAAAAQVPRGAFLPWNEFKQAVALNTGDPKIANFRAAVNAFTNAYARAVKGGTPTAEESHHAYEQLKTAFTSGQFNTVLDTMLGEMTAEMDGANRTLQELGDEFRNTRFGAEAEQKIIGITEALGGRTEDFEIGDQPYQAPAAGHGAPAPAAAGPARKQIKDPDHPGKMIWVRRSADGKGWEEE